MAVKYLMGRANVGCAILVEFSRKELLDTNPKEKILPEEWRVNQLIDQLFHVKFAYTEAGYCM